MNIYIDGVLSNGTMTGSLPATSQSFTNTADLYIGKNKDGNFLSGAIEFARISKGTLAEAKTTIEELYRWQFDGPFLRDFAGNEPIGKRDAGAIENGTKLCDMLISPSDVLDFEVSGGQKSFTITVPGDNYEYVKAVGDFYTAQKTGNTVAVNVTANTRADKREGEVWINGCNETRWVKVIQDAAPCQFDLENDSLLADFKAGTRTISFPTNGNVTATYSGSLIAYVTFNTNKDALNVYFNANNSSAARSGTITLTGCDGTHVVTAYQTGKGLSSNIIEHGQVAVYPNPVDAQLLTVEIPQDVAKCMIIITDLSGKTLHSQVAFGGSQTIGFDAPSGVYTLRVLGDNINFKTKIVVQK